MRNPQVNDVRVRKCSARIGRVKIVKVDKGAAPGMAQDLLPTGLGHLHFGDVRTCAASISNPETESECKELV